MDFNKQEGDNSQNNLYRQTSKQQTKASEMSKKKDSPNTKVEQGKKAAAKTTQGATGSANKAQHSASHQAKGISVEQLMQSFAARGVELDPDAVEAILDALAEHQVERRLDINEYEELLEEKGWLSKIKAALQRFFKKNKALLQMLVFVQFISELIIGRMRVLLAGQGRSISGGTSPQNSVVSGVQKRKLPDTQVTTQHVSDKVRAISSDHEVRSEAKAGATSESASRANLETKGVLGKIASVATMASSDIYKEALASVQAAKSAYAASGGGSSEQSNMPRFRVAFNMEYAKSMGIAVLLAKEAVKMVANLAVDHMKKRGEVEKVEKVDENLVKKPDQEPHKLKERREYPEAQMYPENRVYSEAREHREAKWEHPENRVYSEAREYPEAREADHVRIVSKSDEQLRILSQQIQIALAVFQQVSLDFGVKP